MHTNQNGEIIFLSFLIFHYHPDCSNKMQYKCFQYMTSCISKGSVSNFLHCLWLWVLSVFMHAFVGLHMFEDICISLLLTVTCSNISIRPA